MKSKFVTDRHADKSLTQFTCSCVLLMENSSLLALFAGGWQGEPHFFENTFYDKNNCSAIFELQMLIFFAFSVSFCNKIRKIGNSNKSFSWQPARFFTLEKSLQIKLKREILEMLSNITFFSLVFSWQSFMNDKFVY